MPITKTFDEKKVTFCYATNRNGNPFGTGHIMINSVSLCDKTPQQIAQDEVTGGTTKSTKARIDYLPLCLDCQDIFKNNKKGKWYRWTHGVA